VTEETTVNPNLTTYSMADQIERHRIASRPEVLRTRRIRPVRDAEVRSGAGWLSQLGGAALAFAGRVQQVIPLRRQPAVTR
jgi:hypothetical protein